LIQFAEQACPGAGARPAPTFPIQREAKCAGVLSLRKFQTFLDTILKNNCSVGPCGRIFDDLVKSKPVRDCEESGTQLNEKCRMPPALSKLSAG